ncbi:uncharacterized protein LOC117169717 [Belonocnema kinseyi]|uniref:uncharacterized protein LOC117169717 n=1 Tax=Belonocnema kinseyi TaxID=2817044 RepID=UPI00143D2D18|nr:uncharacterized protein LOC117169717 [Belonocnema kinseyi]
MAALRPVKKDAGRTSFNPKLDGSELKYNDITFPIPFEDIPKFEKMNGLSINVYGLESAQYKLDLKTGALYTSEEKKTIGYFSESQFLQIEEAYLAALDYLNSKLHTFVSNVAVEAKQPTQENVNQQNYTIPKLPKITLPEFLGNYVDWENFRDLFEALIVNNMSLSNVSRLHYLKSLLVGDASHVVKHMTVTDANFTTAWETIKIRYDNKRALINAHLQAIATIPNVSNNSMVELRALRDSTK